jgi:hypothetical protein
MAKSAGKICEHCLTSGSGGCGIYQPDEPRLHILQKKKTVAGFRFLGPRARRQDRPLEIGRNLLVSLFGLSEIAQELADARILRVHGSDFERTS